MSNDKIPTNHGMLGIQSIFDHMNYISYRTQRDAGMTAEMAAKWYPKAAELERQYINANQNKLN